jgi:hypothetical protein
MKDTGKTIFRAPTDGFRFMHPKKHPILRLFQQRANKHFGDRRRINHVQVHTNPKGETFLFGRYGHRKNETLITIGHYVATGFLKLSTLG